MVRIPRGGHAFPDPSSIYILRIQLSVATVEIIMFGTLLALHFMVSSGRLSIVTGSLLDYDFHPVMERSFCHFCFINFEGIVFFKRKKPM